MILRHAKAENNRPGKRDFDRALSERGSRAASQIGKALLGRGLEPELALCSPALRTRQTLALVDAEFGGQTECRFVDDIYNAEPEELMEIVREHGQSASPLLVVGHNPGLHLLALSIAGSGPAADLEAMQARFPTCALAIFEVAIENWRGLGRNIAILQAYLRPRELV